MWWMPYPTSLNSQKKVEYQIKQRTFHFPFTTNVVTKYFRILHYWKLCNSIWSGVKKKLALRALHFLYLRKIIPSRSKPKIETLILGLETPYNAIGNGWGSQWKTFSSEIIVCNILDVKHYWLIMNKDVFQYCQACDKYQQKRNLILNYIMKLVISLPAKPSWSGDWIL